MQFPIVKQFKIDLEGINPENQVNNEPIPVGQPSDYGIIIIPRHAPFFVNSLELYFPNGQPLILDKDYEIYRLMGKLTTLCGQPVASLIKIKTPNTTSVLATYKTVGEFSLVDNSVLQLIVSAAEDDRPVWWENLRNKPTSFTPPLHDHSLIYEMTGFQDTVDFLKDFNKTINTGKESQLITDLNNKISLITGYVTEFGGMLDDYLKRHIESKNAHGLRADQVELGNVDNFATADVVSVTEPRSDLHLTPSALKRIIQGDGFSTDEFLPRGVLPISHYGVDDFGFIPPRIKGGRAGVDCSIETAAINLEPNGEILILQNGYLSGHSNGLYYSRMKSVEDPTVEFTQHKYRHPFIIAQNGNVDRVGSGSADQTILLGDSVANKLYLGLTYGTLNPDKHVFSLITLPIVGFTVNSEMHRLNPVYLGDWVYVFYREPHNGNVRKVFKFKTSSIGVVKTITATVAPLTFTDLDGVNKVAADFNFITTVSPSRCIFNFTPNRATGDGGNWFSQDVQAAKHPFKPNVYVMKVISGVRFLDTNVIESLVEATYEIIPSTGVMELINRIPLITINPNNDSWRTQLKDHSYLANKSLSKTTVVLPNGCIISTGLKADGKTREVYVNNGFQGLSLIEVLGRIWTTDLDGIDATGSSTSGNVIRKDIDLGLVADGFVMSFLEADLVINALRYKTPVGTLDLRDHDPLPANKTFYIYLSVKNNLPTYEASVLKKSENTFLLWVATAITDATKILTIEVQNTSVLNGSSVSTIRRGNASPVTTGSISAEGQLPWLKATDIIAE